MTVLSVHGWIGIHVKDSPHETDDSHDGGKYRRERTIVVHEDVPKEEATVKTFGALKQQHGDWNLNVRCS